MFPLDTFSVSRLPCIVFGAGAFRQLPNIVADHGGRVLIVTGDRSLRESPRWPQLLNDLSAAGVAVEDMKVEAESSPQLVDSVVATFRPKRIDVVLRIGGGSALDAAKEVTGLLLSGHSVMDYLEGVGRDLPYAGPAAPFIAVPTTAGTGSEATKNAVLSVQGAEGFKKSFRHDALVAQVALVDPELLAICPPEVIASNGMDAFTQLLSPMFRRGRIRSLTPWRSPECRQCARWFLRGLARRRQPAGGSGQGVHGLYRTAFRNHARAGGAGVGARPGFAVRRAFPDSA